MFGNIIFSFIVYSFYKLFIGMKAFLRVKYITSDYEQQEYLESYCSLPLL